MKNSSKDNIADELKLYNVNQIKKLADGKVYILKDLVKSNKKMAKKEVIEEEVSSEALEEGEFDEVLDGLESMSD